MSKAPERIWVPSHLGECGGVAQEYIVETGSDTHRIEVIVNEFATKINNIHRQTTGGFDSIPKRACLKYELLSQGKPLGRARPGWCPIRGINDGFLYGWPWNSLPEFYQGDDV